jgi:hypothetical protein
MAGPVPKVTKLPQDRYRIEFSTGDGHIVCEVALHKPGDPPDTRQDAQKQESAMGMARGVAEALVEALTDEE